MICTICGRDINAIGQDNCSHEIGSPLCEDCAGVTERLLHGFEEEELYMNTHIFVCKKCGSVNLYTQEKGTQIGLYCSDCGAWIKWIGKEELYIFNQQKSRTPAKISDTRKAAIDLINKERDRQDLKWGEQNHEQVLWVGILGEEFGEYCQAVNETVFDNGPAERLKGGYDNIIKELTHVAAVAVGAIECLMRGENNAQ